MEEDHAFLINSMPGGASERLEQLKVDEETTFRRVRRLIEVKGTVILLVPCLASTLSNYDTAKLPQTCRMGILHIRIWCVMRHGIYGSLDSSLFARFAASSASGGLLLARGYHTVNDCWQLLCLTLQKPFLFLVCMCFFCVYLPCGYDKQ